MRNPFSAAVLSLALAAGVLAGEGGPGAPAGKSQGAPKASAGKKKVKGPEKADGAPARGDPAPKAKGGAVRQKKEEPCEPVKPCPID